MSATNPDGTLETPARIILNARPATIASTLDADRILEFHRKLPGYTATPLVAAPKIAARLGVGHVWIKDESSRLNLPAYKVLGASWATYRGLEQRLGPFAPWYSVEELGAQLRACRSLELVAATEGNHGRAVARMARWLGLCARILLPSSAAANRVRRIEEEGARVTIVSGSYDDAVRAAAAYDDHTHLVISDTAWEGYREIPGWVVDGYSTLFRETELQLAAAQAPAPEAVAVQMGVGALAASVVNYYRQPGSTTQVIGVEPFRAACILESMAAGKIVDVAGPYDPLMVGLNCGSPSPVAWPVISQGLRAGIALPTAWALGAVQALRAENVSSSPSGATGLGGFFQLLLGAENARMRAEFGWNERTTLLAISTEGAQ